MEQIEVGKIQRWCNELGIRPSKNLGQNFLIDRNILDKIVAAGELSKDDIVLEIGPGFGVLTEELVKHAGRVVAVEMDKRLFERLKKPCLPADRLEEIKLINGDILDNRLFDCSIAPLLGTNYKIIANLPYQITSPILWRFLKEIENKPSMMVVMVQKEVAERIAAQPGKMSILSVLCQFYAEVEVVGGVGRSSFWPAPEVDSAVIKLKVKKSKLKINEDLFFRIVKIGFSAKRKMLKNNLAGGMQIAQEEVIEVLEKIGLDKKIRAQELGVGEWVELVKNL